MKIKDLKDNVQGMREKILDLAMRGKLVAQDKNDEPANVLLEKIAHEKEQLIKEKKIKKTKPLPEITEEEKPFDIPDGWEWVRLGEVTTLGNSISVSPHQINEHTPIIELKDIESKSGKLINLEYANLVEIKSNKYSFKKGNILFGKLRPYLKKIILADFDGICTTELLPFDTFYSYNFYLYYILFSQLIFKQIEKEMQGINLPRITPTKLKKVIFPLPPLNEQKRIAAKVEELFALIDIIEESLTKYEDLQEELEDKVLDLAMQGKLVEQHDDEEPASALLEKIKAEKAELIKEKKVKKTKPLPKITDEEKPFNIPKSWEWVRLGDISEVVMGQAPKGNTVNENNVGIEFHQGKTEFTNKIIGKSNKFTIQDNKIVDQHYILMAVRAPVGDVNLLDRSIFIGRGLAGIHTYLISKNYLFYYLKTKKVYYEHLSTGSTFKAINGNVIKNTPIAIPPLKEQRRILAKLKLTFSSLDYLQ